MFHDLDVRVERHERKSALRSLQNLGYDVIAFTTTVKGVKKIPAEQLPGPRSMYFDDGDGDGIDKKNEKRIVYTDKSKRKKGMTVLERVTLVIEDISQLCLLGSEELKCFDLVACCPINEKLLQQCLQFDFDIIALQLDERVMFQIKRPHIHVAVEKGMLFEIEYASGLRQSSNLRNLVSNSCNITRATNGKHMLLSSGATTLMELRAPLDVINLGILLDLNEQCARNALVNNAIDIVRHGDIRRNVHHGIVRVNDI